MMINKISILLFSIMFICNSSHAESKKNLSINFQSEDVFSKKSIPYSWFIALEEEEPFISWPINWLGGHIRIEITPNQIYVRSGFDNPNASFLYWFESINQKQYQAICSYLKSSTGKKWQRAQSRTYENVANKNISDNLIKPFVSNWDKYSNDELDQDFWAKIYCNINLIIFDINEHLPIGVTHLKGPDEDFILNKKMVRINDDFEDTDVIH